MQIISTDIYIEPYISIRFHPQNPFFLLYNYLYNFLDYIENIYLFHINQDEKKKLKIRH